MRAECCVVVKMGALILELMGDLQKAQGKVERLPDPEDTWLGQDQRVGEGRGWDVRGEGGRPCRCERKGTREQRVGMGRSHENPRVLLI